VGTLVLLGFPAKVFGHAENHSLQEMAEKRGRKKQGYVDWFPQRNVIRSAWNSRVNLPVASGAGCSSQIS